MTIKGNSDPMWETNALLAIDTLAKIGRPFTAYDVAVVMESEPDHPCRWGSVFAKAKATKLIRKVGYSASHRPGRDGGVCAAWGAAA